jgi:hypothetical protein
LANKKGKEKVIHVNKLIVKADEVIVIDERKRRDPWFRRPFNESEAEVVTEAQEGQLEESADHGDNEEGQRRPFSWI